MNHVCKWHKGLVHQRGLGNQLMHMKEDNDDSNAQMWPRPVSVSSKFGLRADKAQEVHWMAWIKTSKPLE